MIVREFKDEDIKQITEIHQKFYSHEFNLDDFCQRFVNFLVIEEDGIIVSAGGIRTIAEAVAITNKDVSARKRREALYKMLQANIFNCNANHFNGLHVFIQDPIWQQHLINAGFRVCKGNALVIEV